MLYRELRSFGRIIELLRVVARVQGLEHAEAVEGLLGLRLQEEANLVAGAVVVVAEAEETS